MPRGKKNKKPNQNRAVQIGNDGNVTIRATKPKKGGKRGLSFGGDFNSKAWSGGFKWTKDLQSYDMGGLGGKMNSLQKNSGKRTAPQIISQSEQLWDVRSGSEFTNVSYAIQPGDPASFPWAADIARKYERYRVLRLKYKYQPIAGIYSESGKQGTVALSVDYDAADSGPANLREVNDTDPHVSCLPYQPAELIVDPGRATPTEGKFVRGILVPPGTDVKTYDAGRLHVSCVGVYPAGEIIGYITCEYVIEFLNPRLNNAKPSANNVIFAANFPAELAVTTGVPKIPLAYVVQKNGIGAIYDGTTGKFKLQPGNYQVNFQYQMFGGTTSMRSAALYHGANRAAQGKLEVTAGDSFEQFYGNASSVIFVEEGDDLIWLELETVQTIGTTSNMYCTLTVVAL